MYYFSHFYYYHSRCQEKKRQFRQNCPPTTAKRLCTWIQHHKMRVFSPSDYLFQHNSWKINQRRKKIPNTNLWWNILVVCWLNGLREIIIINSLEFIRLEELNLNKPLNRFTLFSQLWLYWLKSVLFCECVCHFTYAIEWVDNVYVWFFLRVFSRLTIDWFNP